MNMPPSPPQPTETAPDATALERLVNREDVLQICYWFQGEGFGDHFKAEDLRSFLHCDHAAIAAALSDLVAEGHLVPTAANLPTYEFTGQGKKLGGKMFGETFSDLMRQGHGECADGCCDGDDHSQCGDGCLLH